MQLLDYSPGSVVSGQHIEDIGRAGDEVDARLRAVNLWAMLLRWSIEGLNRYPMDSSVRPASEATPLVVSTCSTMSTSLVGRRASIPRWMP